MSTIKDKDEARRKALAMVGGPDSRRGRMMIQHWSFFDWLMGEIIRNNKPDEVAQMTGELLAMQLADLLYNLKANNLITMSVTDAAERFTEVLAARAVHYCETQPFATTTHDVNPGH